MSGIDQHAVADYSRHRGMKTRDEDGMAKRSSPSEVEPEGSLSLDPIFPLARDFAALVAVLERQLQLVPTADEATRYRIAQAKAAAERGERLSQELIKRVQAQKR